MISRPVEIIEECTNSLIIEDADGVKVCEFNCDTDYVDPATREIAEEVARVINSVS